MQSMYATCSVVGAITIFAGFMLVLTKYLLPAVGAWLHKIPFAIDLNDR